ncbi:hypothetical protein L1987_29968 [Smallanthus sonchifolius]|uniref:Uncharacterized protein n=1 Tax=Smallanthus sonchifolius TaxID=185202 RepID=A0ACB9I318_9ASTR|nr:hypothetical protein L1987_29968 [Smallanthus sonchifolius]
MYSQNTCALIFLSNLLSIAKSRRIQAITSSMKKGELFLADVNTQLKRNIYVSFHTGVSAKVYVNAQIHTQPFGQISF